jgi:hypothetical protein
VETELSFEPFQFCQSSSKFESHDEVAMDGEPFAEISVDVQKFEQ